MLREVPELVVVSPTAWATRAEGAGSAVRAPRAGNRAAPAVRALERLD